MSRNDPLVLVRDMLDHAKEAVEMASERTFDDLSANRMLNLALSHLVKIIGEAASRVPDDFRSLHSDLPWRLISDSRNRLVHGYASVDLQVLWGIVSVRSSSIDRATESHHRKARLNGIKEGPEFPALLVFVDISGLSSV